MHCEIRRLGIRWVDGSQISLWIDQIDECGMDNVVIVSRNLVWIAENVDVVFPNDLIDILLIACQTDQPRAE